MHISLLRLQKCIILHCNLAYIDLVLSLPHYWFSCMFKYRGLLYFSDVLLSKHLHKQEA